MPRLQHKTPGFLPTFARFEGVVFDLNAGLKRRDLRCAAWVKGSGDWLILRCSRLAILVNSDHHRWWIRSGHQHLL